MKKIIMTLVMTAIFGSGLALAQSPQATLPKAQELSEEVLDQFVIAMEQVQLIADELTSDLNAADTQEDAQAVQQAAQEKMVGAVEDTGITVEEYNMVLQIAQQDEEFRAQLQEMIDANK